jgi:two-component system sensor histidine kinase RpfC
MTPLAADKNIDLYENISPDVPYSLIGDPSHLRQILINLISNAIKFTPDGHVQVSVSLAHKNNSSTTKIKFEVSDTGIGIPDDAQKRIFDSFTQADDSTTRRFGGTGLGTTISKELVEAMGGTIGLSSKVDVGTNFWFVIDFDMANNSESFDISILKNLNIIFLSGSDRPVNPFTNFISRFDLSISHVKISDSSDGLLEDFSSHFVNYDAVVVDSSVILEGYKRKTIDLLNRANMRAAYKILLGDPATSLTLNTQTKGLFHSIIETPYNDYSIYNALHAAIPDQEISVLKNQGANAQQNLSLKILVADDNLTNLKVIGKILEKAGHSVTSVSDGQQALEELDNNSYDLGILDMQMPEMDGIDVIKAYRFIKPINEQIPLIILSANVTNKARQESLDAGASDYFTKPIVMNKLIEAINKYATAITNSDSVTRENAAASNDDGMSINHDILDTDTLAQLQNLGDDGEFLYEIVTGFINETSILLDNAEKSLSNHKYKEFMEIIHAIKGSAGSIGAASVYNQCKLIYQMEESELARDGVSMLSNLCKYFEQTENHFQSLLNSQCNTTVA